jgi:predicted regulator of Ras-like GTPase activity (Roadblock/LC7/MglB family)
VFAHPESKTADLRSTLLAAQKPRDFVPAAERKLAEQPKDTAPRKVAALVPPSTIPRTPVVAPRLTSPRPQGEDDDFDASELQALFMTEEHLDAKNIVKHTSRLPGISGCLLMFADGLPIAGNLPEGFSQDAFGAIIPRFMGKVQDYSRDLRLGTIETVTIHTQKGPVSFFMHDKVCMALLHSKSRFLPGVREKLAVVVREVSQMYADTPKH